MKKKILCVLVIAILFLSACSTVKKEIEDPLLDNYYMGSVEYDLQVIRFNSDGIVERVSCGLARRQDKRTTSYGTYKLEKSTLTITISGEDDNLNCVVHNDGEFLTIDGIKFEKCNPDDLSQETIDAFDK